MIIEILDIGQEVWVIENEPLMERCPNCGHCTVTKTNHWQMKPGSFKVANTSVHCSENLTPPFVNYKCAPYDAELDHWGDIISDSRSGEVFFADADHVFTTKEVAEARCQQLNLEGDKK